MTLRYYQQAAIDALYKHLRERDDNPCIVIPTAGGKTPVMATICRDAVTKWSGRVLILAHVKELLLQAADKLQAVCPEVMVGLYSAGLGARDTLAPVIIAGIQSVYKRAAEIGHFDLVIVDEAHLIPPDGDGMYRTLLQGLKAINPHLRIVGLTATPYRLTTGQICGPDNILNTVCYEVGVKELIAQKFICPLISKNSVGHADTSELHLRGGEFIAAEVEALMLKDKVVEDACCEIITKSADRNAVLIFAAGIEHAMKVVNILQMNRCSVGYVFGETEGSERDKTLSDFKAGKIKYLVNVAVLTTGFDAPNIDVVALLRPTMSPGLYYQMIGRGFRLHPAKANCLVLDFGENIMRHGPVDSMIVGPKPDTGGKWEPPPAKECPECHSVIACGFAVCPDCGYVFEKKEVEKKTHQSKAQNGGVISGEVVDTEFDVHRISYYLHYKKNAEPGAPRTLRVDYEVGFRSYKSEWVCIEHPPGYARQKADKWWMDRALDGVPFPTDAEEAAGIADGGGLKPAKRIKVRATAGEAFERIIGYEFGEISHDDAEAAAVAAESSLELTNDNVPF